MWRRCCVDRVCCFRCGLAPMALPTNNHLIHHLTIHLPSTYHPLTIHSPSTHYPQHHVKWTTTATHVQCISVTDIPQEQEILFNYGNHSNGRCFITYGFCHPNNPHNVVPICLGGGGNDDNEDAKAASSSTSTSTSTSSTSTSSTTFGNFGRSGMVSAAVERLRTLSLLAPGQGLQDLVVPSLTKASTDFVGSKVKDA